MFCPAIAPVVILPVFFHSSSALFNIAFVCPSCAADNFLPSANACTDTDLVGPSADAADVVLFANCAGLAVAVLYAPFTSLPADFIFVQAPPMLVLKALPVDTS